jgi:hypothetical protein
MIGAWHVERVRHQARPARAVRPARRRPDGDILLVEQVDGLSHLTAPNREQAESSVRHARMVKAATGCSRAIIAKAAKRQAGRLAMPTTLRQLKTRLEHVAHLTRALRSHPA